MNTKEELRGWIESKIEESYQVITTASPKEAMEKFGFWLDPAEYRIIEGIKHYRVILPHSEKGGWASGYSMPIESHRPDSNYIPASTED